MATSSYLFGSQVDHHRDKEKDRQTCNQSFVYLSENSENHKRETKNLENRKKKKQRRGEVAWVWEQVTDVIL